MKYPDDFLKHLSAPTARGRQDFNVLSGTDAPFQHRVVGDTITTRKDQFAQTRTKANTHPSLAIWREESGGDVGWSLLDYEGPRSVNDVRFDRFFLLPTTTRAGIYAARMTYVGENLLAGVFNNWPDASIWSGSDVVSWPAMLHASTPNTQRLQTEAEDLGRAVSYIDTHQFTGLGAWAHFPQWHATGWDGAAYRAVFTRQGFTDALDPDGTTVPVAYTWDSVTQELVSRTVPCETGRQNFTFLTHCIGPGKLQSICMVEDKTGEPTFEVPYTLTSSDHGETWAKADATFLDAYISRPVTATFQRSFLAANHVNIYLGDGKNLLVIFNGYSGSGSVTGSTYRAMAFLSDDGGASYTRLSWPPDSWAVDSAGEAAGDRVLGPSTDRDFTSGYFAFGEGCMYFPCVEGGVFGWLVTYDFGSTWEIKPVPALPYTGGSQVMTGTVVRRYESADRPGLLVFCYTAAADQRVYVMGIDGTFAAWRKTLGVVRADAVLAAPVVNLTFPDGEFNAFVTHFGGPVHPGFPGEFDKP